MLSLPDPEDRPGRGNLDDLERVVSVRPDRGQIATAWGPRQSCDADCVETRDRAPCLLGRGVPHDNLRNGKPLDRFFNCLMDVIGLLVL